MTDKLRPPYNVIVPRLDKTGPTMLAHDVAWSAHRAGYDVTFYYLSGHYSERDLDFPAKVRKFRFADLFSMRGIVHTHAFRPDLVGALLSFSPKVKTITTIPSYFLADVSFDYPKWKALLAWCGWRFSLRFFDRRVCISQSMLRYYRLKAPRLACELVYNSRLPLNRMANTVAPMALQWIADQRAAGRLVLTYAGGLRPRKNVVGLMKAALATPGVALLVLGGGPLEPALRDMAGLDGDDRIYFGGFVPLARDYMEVTDALVLPSFAEGLANVILEAASVGTPSLLSNIAVHRELAALGIGATFNHKSFADFQAKSDEMRARFISPEARAAVRAVWRRQFDGSASFARYDQLFHEMAAGMDGGGA